MLNVCDNCPMRLFNTKHHNFEGIGNPYSGKLIIIPNIDYDAYKNKDIGYSKQIEIIKNIFPSTGVLDNLYIVPFIRCCENVSCEINDDIIKKCNTYLINDFNLYNFKHILVLGNAAIKFLNIESIKHYIDKVIISSNNRNYCVNYSPAIKFISEPHFIEFERNLIKWYNATMNDNYSEYIHINLK